MTSPLRVGFLGAGLIAHAHARGLRGAPTPYRHVAVFDPDRSRAEAFAAEHGGAVVGDESAVIDAADAVYVCTWTSEHRRLVELAAGAGRGVFCEKPLATGLADARAMTDAVIAAGVVHQVGLVLRSSPAFALLRRLVAAPEAGPVVSMVFRDDQYLPTQGLYGSTWRGDVALAGAGTLLEHSIHDVDLIEHCVGPVVAAGGQSWRYHEQPGIEDVVVATLRFASGALGSVVSVWHDNLARPSLRRVEVLCARRHVTLENDWWGPVRWQDSDGAEHHVAGEELMARLGDDRPPVSPDHEFLAAVAAGGPATPGFEVALRAHEIVDALYRSADIGGVSVPCPPRR
jgi:UDP-N-acetyl-2-amino-2-deoxyglucuronate dehydrogenase